ncbi:methionine synthase [Spirochaetota bacterium]
MHKPDISSIELAINSGRILADGATGTMLDSILGDSLADKRDLLPVEQPEVIKKLHLAYLSAGAELVKTATFNASELGLKRFAGKETASSLAYRINQTAASLARSCCNEAVLADGKARWVAGSIGPGTEAPSLGGLSYHALKASYLPQCLGLIEGGADIALIETVQDSLQCKAAMGALREAERLSGKSLPFIVSASVDSRGRLLSGADAEAFAAIIEPFKPLALGLNCSGGPDELEAAFESLSKVSSLPLSIMPNAGLPHSEGGRVTWPLDAGSFAQKTMAIAQKYGAAIIGGCCGTGPEYISRLVACISGIAKPADRPKRVFALASSFKRAAPDKGILIIDERANAAGSSVFKAILNTGDMEAAAQFAIGRAKKGSGAVDISVAGAKAAGGISEAELLSAIVSRLATVAEAAISVDTSDLHALEACLPLIPGRPLVNSVNLEDEEKAIKTIDLAKEYGAAIVCLAMDSEGPAYTAAKKLKVCQKLYALALSRGLEPEDLLFDPCTFPLASGDKSMALSAVESFAAIEGLKEACPGSASVLGVGNSSFGLPKAMRPGFTSRFLHAAKARGLGAAIMDPSILDSKLTEEQERLMDELILAKAGLSGYGQALERLLSRVHEQAITLKLPGNTEQAPNEKDAATILFNSIVGGNSGLSVSAAMQYALEEGQTAAAGQIAKAMTELGRRYDKGFLALPLVLRSADAARDAFSAIKAKHKSKKAGQKLVLSTVKGDLHDIGKNLVGMVLEAAGYEVLDLGTDRSAEDIANAAHGAIAVGVSGLLTRSLAEMTRLAKVMAETHPGIFLLFGGAAVDSSFVEASIEPVCPGKAAYAKDPFDALNILKNLKHGVALPAKARTCSNKPENTEAMEAASLVKAYAFSPPFLGSASLPDMELDELLGKVDEKTIYRSRWKYKDDNEGKAALHELIECAKEHGGIKASARYGFFKAGKTGNSVSFSDDSGREQAFLFPVLKSGHSIASFYAETDSAAAFCVTLGSRAESFLNKQKGNSSLYLRAHGLLAGLAEAAAAISHERINNMLKDKKAKGKRFSFGFPACPGVEYNAALLELLEAGRIELSVNEGHMLTPEFSVTAIIIPRAEARYLS